METVCGTYNGNGGGSEPAMSYYKVVYEGGVIKHNGQTLTYAQLVDKYNDNKYFLYAEANGLTMIPALPPMESDPILEFSCSWIYDGKATISRLIINSNNQVKYENKYLTEDVTDTETVNGAVFKRRGNVINVAFQGQITQSGGLVEFGTTKFKSLTDFTTLPMINNTNNVTSIVGVMLIDKDGNVQLIKNNTFTGFAMVTGTYITSE